MKQKYEIKIGDNVVILADSVDTASRIFTLISCANFVRFVESEGHYVKSNVGVSMKKVEDPVIVEETRGLLGA